MFTYCKRVKHNDRDKRNKDPYNYHMSDLQTMRGFSRGPSICPSLNPPWVNNRGIPRGLLEMEDALKGRACQPFCVNEPHEPRFSTFRPPLVLPKGIPPCAPVPVIELRGYGGAGDCGHASGRAGFCDDSCHCSARCQCKGPWRGMNATMKPLFGPAGLATASSQKVSF